jgi:hypothetical protein
MSKIRESEANKESDLVCHCFHYTKKDIENDFLENGLSTIYERIKHEKQLGACNCFKENPKGT